MRNAEGLEGGVAFINVGVTGRAEVGAVDGGAQQAVAHPLHRVKPGLQQLFLLGRGKLRKHFSRGIGYRSANTQHGLEAVAGGDKHGRVGLLDLLCGLQGCGSGRAEVGQNALGAGVDAEALYRA